MEKIIQISDEIFWGFNIKININNFNSFEELIKYTLNELIIFLNNNNLLNLVDKAKELNLHNHNFNSYNELYNTNDEIIYLCNNC
jgi:hypothetical protein